MTRPQLELCDDMPTHDTLNTLLCTYPNLFRQIRDRPGWLGWIFQACRNGDWMDLYEGNDKNIFVIDSDADIIMEQVLETVTE